MKGILPSNILEKMRPQDRPKGSAGMTTEEAQQKFRVGEEKKLQKLVNDYLFMRGIYFETDRFGKRTGAKAGRPDFRICYRGRFLAVECKAMRGVTSTDQIKTIQRIEDSGGMAVIIYSLSELQSALIRIDEQVNLLPGAK